MLAVVLECPAALLGELVDRAGPVGGECLFDGHISTVHQAGHVRVHVPSRKTGLLSEVHKVGFVNHEQGRHDDKAGRLVNDAVDLTRSL